MPTALTVEENRLVVAYSSEVVAQVLQFFPCAF